MSAEVSKIADISEQPLEVEAALARLDDARDGAVAAFVGRVRNHDGGAGVTHLEYSAHPTALERLIDVIEQVAGRHDVHGLIAVHRVGHLEIGDAAVITAASSSHRGVAFDACRDLIDTLKETVPIWKHQVFTDGTSEWVGTP